MAITEADFKIQSLYNDINFLKHSIEVKNEEIKRITLALDKIQANLKEERFKFQCELADQDALIKKLKSNIEFLWNSK